MIRQLSFAALMLVLIGGCFAEAPADSTAAAPSSTSGQTAATKAAGVGEVVPSEDPLINNMHSLGLLQGKTDVFRCACPVRDIAKKMATTQPDDAELSQATGRMKHLYDLGIRTIISFQKPGEDGPGKKDEQGNALVLEKQAAEAAGVTFVPMPMANSGSNSLEDMTDDQVLKWVDSAAKEILADGQKGGVAFHCSAGHDRTGIVAAYIRMKYQHWPVEQAIAEMRRDGHNWPKYSHNGGVSSWHEDHLRGIAKMMAESE